MDKKEVAMKIMDTIEVMMGDDASVEDYQEIITGVGVAFCSLLLSLNLPPASAKAYFNELYNTAHDTVIE